MTACADTAVFYFVNKSLANPFFDVVMPFMSRLGSGDIAFIAAMLMAIFLKKEKRMAGILILAGLTATYYIVFFLKEAIARPRPFMALADLRLLVPAERQPSMPSGHSASAFMIAAILSYFFRYRALWLSAAAIVAFSRVYAGVHYPSDVIAGGLLGYMTGRILLRLAGFDGKS